MKFASDHPVWFLGYLVVAVLGLSVILWHNCSNFDETERVTIAQYSAFLVGLGGAYYAIKRVAN